MSAEVEPTVLEVGRVTKAHGLTGEVVVILTTDQVQERTAAGTCLWVGDLQMEIESARPFSKRWLFRFVGVKDRNSADRLRGAVLKAEPLVKDDAVFIHEVVGKDLVDQNDENHGRIEGVLANPASDLLELADGGLVPFTFVTSVTDETVHVDVPAGLLGDT